MSKGSINLGDGTDKVTLSSAANVVTISNVESIVGGSGNDTVTLATELRSTDSIDLTLRLRQADAGQLRQHRLAGQHRDAGRRHERRHHHVHHALANASIDLGAGTDSLSLSSAANTATVSNVESILGGSGADTITLSTILANVTIDLYSGSDKLTLGNFANVATIIQRRVGGRRQHG